MVTSAALFVQELVCQLQVLRNTIQKYDKQIEAIAQQHPDFPIVSSFPGIGKALAPRLIAALGTQRERFPERRASKTTAALRRYVKPAEGVSGYTPGGRARSSSNKPSRKGHNIQWHIVLGRAHYDVQRARGKGHQAAIRSIAFKWIRILVRCWQDHIPYDEARYKQSLSRRSGTPSTAVTIVCKNVAGFSKLTGLSA